MKMAGRFHLRQAGQKVMSGIANPIPYKTIEETVITERILKGNDIDLTSFPAPTFSSSTQDLFNSCGWNI